MAGTINDASAQNANKAANAVQPTDEPKAADVTEPNDAQEAAPAAAEAQKTKPNKLLSTTYIFSRYDPRRYVYYNILLFQAEIDCHSPHFQHLLFPSSPLIVIPSPDHFTIAVRCCPQVFELRPHTDGHPPLIDLPYRMVFAIASKSSIYLYDTQQKIPFGCISNIHYARLTDITWSSDGSVLIVSSVDGFCTVISFEPGELGTKYTKPILIENANDNKENLLRSNKKKQKSQADKVHKSANKSDTASSAVATNSNTNTNKTTGTKPATFKGDVIVEFPETIIASAESFESPEYKTKQATPIAIRREPRAASSPSVPTDSKSKSKPTPIAIRRVPRPILTSPCVIDNSTADQDEALDAWPTPIDAPQKTGINGATEAIEQMEIDEQAGQRSRTMDTEQTEDMRLVYEGDSELTILKTSETIKSNDEKCPGEQQPDASNADGSSSIESKNQKTPRRVQLKTISTPKSKKKLIN